MENISSVTQQLVNVFPEWTRVRSDEQSVGFQLLNTAGGHIEDLEINLQRLKDNLYLNTVNLRELDLIYKIDVSSFEFTKEFQNGIFLKYTTPTATAEYTDQQGATQSTAVSNIDDGSLTTFLNTDPNRISSSSSFQGTPVSIVDADVNTLTPELGETNSVYPITHHHPEGGKFLFSIDAGYPYLYMENQEVKRARIRIVGTNENGKEDSETIVFPWKSTVSSRKNWKTLEYIEHYDLKNINIHNDSTSQTPPAISIYSESVQHPDYISLNNLRFSKNRNKIDEFWGLINYTVGDPQGASSYLERVEYVTDQAQSLLRGVVEKFTKQRWRLQTPAGVDIPEVKDMALIPYKDKFWGISETKLYLFSLSIENYEKFDKLQERDPEAEISITSVTEDIVTGEDFLFSVWHERQINEIQKIKVWYTSPGGTDIYLTNSGSDGFVNNEASNRILFSSSFSVTEEGDHVLSASVEFADGTTQTDKRLFRNRNKKAIKEFNLSGILTGVQTATGIYFDSDGYLQLKASDNTYYKIDEQKDIMLIDFTNKNIYLHENYTKVTVV